MQKYKIVVGLSLALVVAASTPSLAYVDPGLAGILFQVGYVIFYGIVGALAYLARPFSFLRRKKQDSDAEKDGTDEASESKKEAQEDPTKVDEPGSLESSEDAAPINS